MRSNDRPGGLGMRAFVTWPRGQLKMSRFVGAFVLAILIALPVTRALANPALVWQYAGIFRTVSVSMFLAAGALRLSRWRITRDSRSALMGVALIIFGASSVPLVSLVSTPTPGTAIALEGEIALAAVTAVVLAFVVTALHAPERDDRIQPAPLLAGGVAMTIVGCVVVGAFARLAPGLFDVGPVSLVAVDLTTGAAWCGVAWLAWTRWAADPWAKRVAPLLAVMGVVEMLRVMTVHDLSVALLTTLLTSFVACTATYCALLDLLEAIAAEHAQLESTEQALTVANTGVIQRDAWREELSHDACNSLAGLRATLTMLDRYDDRLDVEEVRRLRAAAIGEIAHLEHLVRRSSVERATRFDVGEVIRNLVETRRATGLRVLLGDVDGLALGRVGDFATVLQNLLVNVEHHAPGSPVMVSVDQAGDALKVLVADHGPGIPADRAQHVFDRGTRGTHSTSTGLGLYVARQLMREQYGDLELRSHASGCVFVVSIPAASPAVMADIPARVVAAQRGPSHLRPVPSEVLEAAR